MESEDILNDLRDSVKSMMKERHIDRYQLNIEGSSEKGENYIGVIIFFNVSCEDTGKEYNLVFKTCKRFGESKDGKDMDRTPYINEINMYADILPRLRTFGREVCPNFELDNVPQAFSFIRDTKHESFIMENLKSGGYKLWDRMKPMDMDHVQLVLKNYGKFHATSMALRDQKQEQFQELIKGDLFKHMPIDIDTKVQISKNDFDNVIKVLRKFGKNDIAEKFEEVSTRLRDILEEYTPEVDRLAVLHGDCWNNNLMFKYKDDKYSELDKMCFLDFQLSHFDSPVKDLSFYLYTACDESTLKHFDLLMETYYDSFSSTFKSLGSRPEDVFTMKQLKEHWQKYSIFGLTLSPLFLKIELCTESEAPNFENFEKDDKPPSDPFNFVLENNDLYERRLLDVFTHYADTCL